MSTYECAACGASFVSRLTTEEAMARYAEEFPEAGPASEPVPVCPQCSRAFRLWLDANPTVRRRHGWDKLQ